jgi:hypothetical protein
VYERTSGIAIMSGSCLAGGEAGEPGAVREQVVEVMYRDELGVRLAVHVDELREQELDPLVGDHLPHLVGTERRRDHPGRYIPSSLDSAMVTSAIAAHGIVRLRPM